MWLAKHLNLVDKTLKMIFKMLLLANAVPKRPPTLFPMWPASQKNCPHLLLIFKGEHSFVRRYWTVRNNDRRYQTLITGAFALCWWNDGEIDHGGLFEAAFRKTFLIFHVQFKNNLLNEICEVYSMPYKYFADSEKCALRTSDFSWRGLSKKFV